MALLASSCLVGLPLAYPAVARRERLRGLAASGLILNAPIPLLLLGTGLQSLGGWSNPG